MGHLAPRSKATPFLWPEDISVVSSRRGSPRSRDGLRGLTAVVAGVLVEAEREPRATDETRPRSGAVTGATVGAGAWEITDSESRAGLGTGLPLGLFPLGLFHA